MYATFLQDTSSNPSQSVANYIGIAGVGSWGASATLVDQPAPHAMVIDQLVVSLATSAGSTWIFTIFKNGVSTGITVSITGANTTGSDMSNTASVVAGDVLCIQSDRTGTPNNPAGVRISLRQFASGVFAVLGGNSTTAITTTQFNNAQGASVNISGAEANVAAPQALAMTASNLFIKSSEDPSPGNWSIQLRNEIADTNLVAALSAGQLTNSDTSHTAAFTAGQRWAMHSTAAATPTASRLQWGFTVTPAVDGQSTWTAQNINQYDNATARMMRVNGNQGSLSTTDVAAQCVTQAGTAKALYAHFGTNPGGTTKLYTVGMFKSGTATTLSLTSNAVGLASITGLTEVLANGDLVNINVTPSGTPTASRIGTGILFAADTGAAAPVNSVAPVASGTASRTFSFTSTTGTWSNSPTATTYQWQRDVAGNLSYSNIASATAANYTATSSDLTCHVRCVVTASNASGSGTSASNALGPVGDQLAVVSSVGAEWCANATVVFSAGAPVTSTYLNTTTGSLTTGWSTWYT